jgi:dihydroorotate dehydrogenase
MSCYQTLRPLLFNLPPEKAHRAAIRALQLGLAPRSNFTHPSLASTVAGLRFCNPVGLAPGFDKNAECFDGALKAGFGFVEIGTVTPRAQAGNPAPRLFRLVEHEAIINRLGFNNEGMDAASARLQKRGPGIIGGNVGKNKDSTDAVADYVSAMRALYSHVDYITANISSPNTPGLRNLQAKDELTALVRALHKTRGELGKYKPIFVKIAPDNDVAALEAIAQVALAEKLDGLIVGNTTIDKSWVAGHAHAGEQGGLSGKPLMGPSTEILRKMYTLTEGKIPLIGVGGISSAEDAYAKILAGASLVQLYTALVYQGFGLVEKINRGLVELLARDGFSSIQSAVGRSS